MKYPRAMVSFISLVCLMVFMTGCATTRVPTTPVEHDLVGSWRWIKSVGGIAFETRTPETEGYTKTVQFTSGRTYRLYVNGQHQVTFDYVLKHEYNRWLRETADVIHYYHEGNPQPGHAYRIQGDTLSLVGLCADCFSDSYVREDD